MDIEAAQYVLSCGFSATLTDLPNRRHFKVHDYDDGDEPVENSFYNQRQALLRNISAIRPPQRLYMPGIDHLLNETDPVVLANCPETVQVWFPSDLPLPTRDDWCAASLPRLEYRLRYAIAANTLQDICRFRQFSQAISTKTQSHISNTQKTGTRGRGQFERVQQKITRAAATYQACWSAIKRLAPNEEFGAWKNTLQELRQEDIRGPGREKSSETSESHYVPSWIWHTPLQGSASGDDQDLSLALQVEWCKAQERATQYEEEIELVVEEMRRTLVFFEWRACEWESRATTPLTGSSEVDSTAAVGVSAYAYKQASVYRKMVDVFVNDWYKCLKTKSLGSSWLLDNLSTATKQQHLPSNV